MNKPKQVFGVFALLLVLAFAPAAWSQGPLQMTTIAANRDISSIGFFIAQDRGFFREEGLVARLVQVRATVGDRRHLIRGGPGRERYWQRDPGYSAGGAAQSAGGEPA